MFDDFQELHGDRLFTEDAAIVGGLARSGDLTVMAIGHQKGHTTGEMMERNFGMPDPEGYRKALRLMHYAARFGLPIVTLVDTPGAYPGSAPRSAGSRWRSPSRSCRCRGCRCRSSAVVIGEGGSGGALAMAAADRVMMLRERLLLGDQPRGLRDDPVQGCARGPRAAAALRMTAPSLLRLGVVDGVVPEPEAGAHTDPAIATAENLKTAIVRAAATARLDRRGAAGPALRALPRVRPPGRPAGTPVRGDPMTDTEAFKALCAEARDLMKRLEGSSVQG